jgi:hypothetical protein
MESDVAGVMGEVDGEAPQQPAIPWPIHLRFDLTEDTSVSEDG